MSELTPSESEFLNELTALVEKNIGNEQFGVTELAELMNMSRSNLLRKVKKITDLSVSQFISELRLKRGMELLKTTSHNVSEVSHQVGFNSTSYFIKCFREYYGYPPGEVGKRDLATPSASIEESIQPDKAKRRYGRVVVACGALLVITAAIFLVYNYNVTEKILPTEKSIVVLPFKNDSADSTNVYLINGLMEATLNNLQQIKDLKVISRTSAEKYRNARKSIPEMAHELNVNYFIEGSGQKIGDRILLNIQLIDGVHDKHLWSKQYRREAKDIFELQREIAQNIADEIKVVITPDEQKRITKKPTENLEAYDSFLKGREFFYQATSEGLRKSVPYYKAAIEQDNRFALAYADLAMVYAYMDMYQTEHQHEVEINSYADKALLLDPNLVESLVAKAMYYMVRKDYKQQVSYLEKALAYNPNSTRVIHMLADIYNLYLPNSAKYLEYALKGLQLDVAGQDSATLSYTYLHVGNALVQTGFIDHALTYINKSLAYNPKNPFSGYCRVFILYAKTRNISEVKPLMINELNKDTTRLDVLCATAEVCFIARDFDASYRYYKRFVETRETKKLEILQNEDIKISLVFAKKHQNQEAQHYLESFKHFAENDRSIYRHALLANYYANHHEPEKALEHLRLFSKEENYQFWILLLPEDPISDPIKNLPEFKSIMHDIEVKFWKRHDEIRETLIEQRLL